LSHPVSGQFISTSLLLTKQLLNSFLRFHALNSCHRPEKGSPRLPISTGE
jgi:hypothetical protein